MNLKQLCRTDLPELKGTNGKALTDTLEWYQDEYTECAANHNGLIQALKERGVK